MAGATKMAGDNKSMRPITLKVFTTMAFIFALTLFVGCGGADTDELGLRFRVAGPVTYDDNGTDDGRVDMYDTTAGCTSGTEELYSFWVTVPFESDLDMDTDGYIDSIDVNITPNGANFLDFDYTITNIQNGRIPANGGTLDLSILLITPSEKEDYVTDYAGDYTNPTLRSFSVTLNTNITYTPLEPEVHYEVPPVTFGFTGTEIDNCSDAS